MGFPSRLRSYVYPFSQSPNFQMASFMIRIKLTFDSVNVVTGYLHMVGCERMMSEGKYEVFLRSDVKGEFEGVEDGNEILELARKHGVNIRSVN